MQPGSPLDHCRPGPGAPPAGPLDHRTVGPRWHLRGLALCLSAWLTACAQLPGLQPSVAAASPLPAAPAASAAGSGPDSPALVADHAVGAEPKTEPDTLPNTAPATVTAGEAVSPAAATAAATEAAEAADAPAASDEGPAATIADPTPDPETAQRDLWQRVRDGFALDDLDNDLVRRWERYYAGQPAYVERMATRGGRYLFHIMEEVDRRGLPAELALLPFIESAFNPQAMSRVKASGMWQFMPATGREFELRQNLFRDDRRSVLASTQAALDYLQRLHQRFGDWQLALAAYNWGQGNVQRALDANRKAGRGLDYASLRMPDETRNYVPKLQAVKNLFAEPERFGLSLPALANHPYFLSVNIQRDIDVTRAAALAGLSLDEFQALNPQHNKPVILAAGTPQVLLPYDNAARFVQALAQAKPPLATWTAWVAPRTLKPAEAARIVGMNEAALRQVNRIPPRMLVRKGSTLLVPRGAGQGADVAEHIADNGKLALTPEARPPRRIQFRAGAKGDTLAAVARRHGVAPKTLAQLNRLPANARFAPGQRVALTLPPARARAKSPAANRPAQARPAAAQARAQPPARQRAQAKAPAKAQTRAAAPAAAKRKAASAPAAAAGKRAAAPAPARPKGSASTAAAAQRLAQN